MRLAGRCGERTERCQWQRKRSERVAAVKISSVRRKAAQKFWAPQQGHCPLRTHNKRCGERKESPSHGFAVTAPFRQGGRGDGRGGLPRALCALAMILLTRSAECGGTHGSRPTLYLFCRAGPVCPAGGAIRNRRADRGIRSYGSDIRSAVGGPSRTPPPYGV